MYVALYGRDFSYSKIGKSSFCRSKFIFICFKTGLHQQDNEKQRQKTNADLVVEFDVPNFHLNLFEVIRRKIKAES